MTNLGVKCQSNSTPWWAPNQPGFVSGVGDPNFGECLGFVDVPSYVSCQAYYWSVSRLCHCSYNVENDQFFGTGLSSAFIPQNETAVFAHKIAPGHTAAMTHFWVTASQETLDDSIFRYYFDGEKTPSVEFIPGPAVGVGFSDTQAPWGTKWFGVGAGNGHGTAYFLNFKMPFSSQVVVTIQRPSGTRGGFYTIFRGALDVDIEVGGRTIPKNATLKLQKNSTTLQPLDFLAVTDVPSGSGVHFMSTLIAKSGNLNFLEGCYHAYSPYNRAFPGTVMSTGTEDYFDSGWYFNAGEFHFPVSGFTHINQTNGVEWSAYRFHEMDPLFFSDGLKFVWRNGDMVDKETGNKCFTESGGIIVGSPTASEVTSYSWVYVW
eukprot:m.69724 g.69724  ORF g.69724 m.69724 type:complete len:375 (+) comp8281_c0_seq6:792-1916(+)